MNQLRFMSLSFISYIFLSGFLFEERGMSMPAPEKKPTPKEKVSKEDDFPLIKIKAFPNKKVNSSEKNHIEKSKKVTKNPNRNKAIETNTNTLKSMISSLVESIAGIFTFNKETKQSSQVSGNTHGRVSEHSINVGNKTEETNVNKRTVENKNINDIHISRKYKSKEKKSKRRQIGHVHKLIFNKNTSLSDIPLPLPNLKSLKLKSLIKSIPTIPLSKLPIVNAIIPKSSKVAKRRLRSQQNSMSNLHHSKKNIAGTLDMANIRIAKSNDYTTLIFDSYKWSGYNNEPTKVAQESGNYNFKYEPKHNRIVAVIDGYTSFSALLGDQSQLFKGSDVIKNIYIDRYIGDSSIKFIIKLKKKIQMTVQNLKNPGRIVLNIYPQ